MLEFIVTSCLLVFASREPCQALFINVEAQRIHTSYCNVDPQIEFETIDQQWVLNILTDHGLLLSMRYLSQTICQEDTPALRAGRRLDNPVLVRIALHLVFQEHELVWQDERLWNESKLV